MDPPPTNIISPRTMNNFVSFEPRNGVASSPANARWRSPASSGSESCTISGSQDSQEILGLSIPLGMATILEDDDNVNSVAINLGGMAMRNHLIINTSLSNDGNTSSNEVTAMRPPERRLHGNLSGGIAALLDNLDNTQIEESEKGDQLAASSVDTSTHLDDFNFDVDRLSSKLGSERLDDIQLGESDRISIASRKSSSNRLPNHFSPSPFLKHTSPRHLLHSTSPRHVLHHATSPRHLHGSSPRHVNIMKVFSESEEESTRTVNSETERKLLTSFGVNNNSSKSDIMHSPMTMSSQSMIGSSSSSMHMHMGRVFGSSRSDVEVIDMSAEKRILSSFLASSSIGRSMDTIGDTQGLELDADSSIRMMESFRSEMSVESVSKQQMMDFLDSTESGKSLNQGAKKLLIDIFDRNDSAKSTDSVSAKDILDHFENSEHARKMDTHTRNRFFEGFVEFHVGYPHFGTKKAFEVPPSPTSTPTAPPKKFGLSPHFWMSRGSAQHGSSSEKLQTAEPAVKGDLPRPKSFNLSNLFHKKSKQSPTSSDHASKAATSPVYQQQTLMQPPQQHQSQMQSQPPQQHQQILQPQQHQTQYHQPTPLLMTQPASPSQISHQQQHQQPLSPSMYSNQQQTSSPHNMYHPYQFPAPQQQLQQQQQAVYATGPGVYSSAPVNGYYSTGTGGLSPTAYPNLTYDQNVQPFQTQQLTQQQVQSIHQQTQVHTQQHQFYNNQMIHQQQQLDPTYLQGMTSSMEYLPYQMQQQLQQQISLQANANQYTTSQQLQLQQFQPSFATQQPQQFATHSHIPDLAPIQIPSYSGRLSSSHETTPHTQTPVETNLQRDHTPVSSASSVSSSQHPPPLSSHSRSNSFLTKVNQMLNSGANNNSNESNYAVTTPASSRTSTHHVSSSSTSVSTPQVDTALRVDPVSGAVVAIEILKPVVREKQSGANSSALEKRGAYKCSKCGQLKADHVCKFNDKSFKSKGSQVYHPIFNLDAKTPFPGERFLPVRPRDIQQPVSSQPAQPQLQQPQQQSLPSSTTHNVLTSSDRSDVSRLSFNSATTLSTLSSATTSSSVMARSRVSSIATDATMSTATHSSSTQHFAHQQHQLQSIPSPHQQHQQHPNTQHHPPQQQHPQSGQMPMDLTRAPKLGDLRGFAVNADEENEEEEGDRWGRSEVGISVHSFEGSSSDKSGRRVLSTHIDLSSNDNFVAAMSQSDDITDLSPDLAVETFASQYVDSMEDMEFCQEITSPGPLSSSPRKFTTHRPPSLTVDDQSHSDKERFMAASSGDGHSSSFFGGSTGKFSPVPSPQNNSDGNSNSANNSSKNHSISNSNSNSNSANNSIKSNSTQTPRKSGTFTFSKLLGKTLHNNG